MVDGAPRFTREELLEELKNSLQEGTAREYVPDKPPAYATGRDAEIFARAARLEIDRAISKFLTSEEIDRRIDKAITDRLKAIGLNTDEEHIEETGELVRRTVRWQRYFDKIWSRIAIAILGAGALAVLKLIGVNVSLLGLGDH